jgi:hypothetical protein
VSGAEHGHPLLVEPTELVDLPGLDELDRLQDLGRRDPVGGPTLVGWAPRGRPPRLSEGVSRLGAGRLSMGGVMVGDERAGREAGGHPGQDPTPDEVPTTDPRSLLVLRLRLGRRFRLGGELLLKPIGTHNRSLLYEQCKMGPNNA